MSKSADLLSQEPSPAEVKEIRRSKKEKKEKKDRERSKPKRKAAEVDADAKLDVEPAPAEEPTSTKKRKREALPSEIEIDINLPEPASKKAARRAKKAKLNPSNATTTTATAVTSDAASGASATTAADGEPQDTNKDRRTAHGIWVGNLPWTATKETLRTFLTTHSADSITDADITRIHMPAPNKPPSNPRWTDAKPKNKGFAYVDFASQLAMYAAIALTETKLDGRSLLIKNARSFEGRPDKPKEGGAGGEEGDVKGGAKGKGVSGGAGVGGYPPSKRVFVGNLAFEVSKEDLQAHFGQCGIVEHIHMATFEDTGKCKGFAWVTFSEVEAAEAAVRGWVYKIQEEDKDEDEDIEDGGEDNNKKSGKRRKWKLNKLFGREIRCEFAEDSTTRYNKRFGKKDKEAAVSEGVHPDRAENFGRRERVERKPPQQQQKEGKRKADPRNVKAGAAHMNAQRASQAIVEGKGKKTTFE